MRRRSTVAVLSAAAVGAGPGGARPVARDMLDPPPPRRRMHPFHLPVAVHRRSEPESGVLPSGEIDGESLLYWRLSKSLRRRVLCSDGEEALCFDKRMKPLYVCEEEHK
ncbi:hypothetical protein OPV22_027156 [Ensete ventricosum]|uniref:Uncharacterized protein n=1 Tax=Ensete ventricosum TaxID=4639 RepID=A0AAV8Q6Q3_ENSVE|nr:hypothetical protein OPV22_027156 [Ensete ventricosum]